MNLAGQTSCFGLWLRNASQISGLFLFNCWKFLVFKNYFIALLDPKELQ